jgi:bacillithiol biosynthesis deacetylase BshB1
MPETIELDILAFGTHPDDIEIGCGGTLAKLAEEGYKTGLIDLSRGELGTRGTVQTRKTEADNAAKVLGAQLRKNLKIEDGNIRLNRVNKEKVIKVIRKYRPKIVFAPYPFDRHPDHISAGNLIREAAFGSGLKKIIIKSKEGILKEYRPDKVYYYQQTYDIPVTFIFDISDTFEKKLEAMKFYGSQFYTGNNDLDNNEPETFVSRKGFTDLIIARSKIYGEKIGEDAGEAFFSYEPVKITASTFLNI